MPRCECEQQMYFLEMRYQQVRNQDTTDAEQIYLLWVYFHEQCYRIA